MLLDEIPLDYLSPDELRAVGDTVFGNRGRITTINSAVPLIKAPVFVGSSFGVSKVELERDGVTKVVVLKISGNDLRDEFPFAASDNPRNFNYFAREPQVYGDKEVLDYLKIGNGEMFRFPTAYRVTPPRDITVVAAEKTFTTQGMWLEYIPALSPGLQHPSFVYEAAAELMAMRDARSIARKFHSHIRAEPEIDRWWFASRTTSRFYEHFAQRSPAAYDVEAWRVSPNSSITSRWPLRVQQRVLDEAAEIWTRREDLYRVLDGDNRLRVMALGDFHGGNFEPTLNTIGKPCFVSYDLSAIGEYGIGKDVVNLAISASTKPCWIGMTAKNVTDHLLGIYTATLRSQLQQQGFGETCDNVERQARQNFAAEIALQTVCAGMIFDPIFEKHFSDDRTSQWKAGLLEMVPLGISYGKEALSISRDELAVGGIDL